MLRRHETCSFLLFPRSGIWSGSRQGQSRTWSGAYPPHLALTSTTSTSLLPLPELNMELRSRKKVKTAHHNGSEEYHDQDSAPSSAAKTQPMGVDNSSEKVVRRRRGKLEILKWPLELTMEVSTPMLHDFCSVRHRTYF